MSFAAAYIKEKRRPALCALLCLVIIAVCFYLYGLPMEAVLYIAVLCIAVASVFIYFDFKRAKNKHAVLSALRSLPENLDDQLKKYGHIDDGDYAAIISALNLRAREQSVNEDKLIEDMTDYYTAWVHQIKTPISSMELLLQQENSSLAIMLRNELSKIEQYVGMVMTYIRLNSDSSDYVFRLTSLDGIVKNTVKKFSSQFIARKLRLEYSPLDRKIVTDEKWLGFVIEQILSNALKYTHEGSVSIYLEDPCVLCIKDTGMGIAAEDMPRIFEKGYTGQIGRANYSASGLGLYLSGRICAKLGCRIWAESEIYKGTTVKIDLEKSPISD